MRFGRAHWFHPDELNEEQQALYARMVGGRIDGDSVGPGHSANPDGRLYGGHNVRLLDPKVGAAIEELVIALRFDISLPARCVEICCLETARHERSNIEWSGHAKRARKLGMTDDDVAAILDGREAPGLDGDEQLVRRVAQALLRERDLSDELFEDAEAALGPPAIFDIISVVGQYQHTALSLRVWRTPPRPGSEIVFDVNEEVAR